MDLDALEGRLDEGETLLWSAAAWPGLWPWLRANPGPLIGGSLGLAMIGLPALSLPWTPGRPLQPSAGAAAFTLGGLSLLLGLAFPILRARDLHLFLTDRRLGWVRGHQGGACPLGLGPELVEGRGAWQVICSLRPGELWRGPHTLSTPAFGFRHLIAAEHGPGLRDALARLQGLTE